MFRLWRPDNASAISGRKHAIAAEGGAALTSKKAMHFH
jgi:hypothetical protein